MVLYKEIITNNELLKAAGPGLIAVFVGATNGIGLGALKAFAKHMDSPTIYIVGRSLPRLERLITELKGLNNIATIFPVIAKDLTLVKDAEMAVKEISATAKKVDILIMSPGYLTFSRNESPEGLDRFASIRFYSRMQFLVSLAPLLRLALKPRVISVLGGGKEGQLWADDLLLNYHYSFKIASDATSSMTTLFFEEFARQPENGRISLIHVYPGLIGDSGLTVVDIGPWTKFILDWVLSPVMRLVGYTSVEAGERVVFAATSGRFRRLEFDSSVTAHHSKDCNASSGVYLVRADSSVVTENPVLKKMKSEGMGSKVYQHTLSELTRILNT